MIKKNAIGFIAALLFLISVCNLLEARVYFLHVPKTGGTTLRLLLESQLSTAEIYPHRNSKSALTPIRENLVSGHFPYWFCKKKDSKFDEAFKITVLREPVERYLSFLRAKKKTDTSLPDLESVLKLRLSRQKKYAAGLIDNAYCRYLTTDPSLKGEALLENAKRTLDELDYVVFFDHFNTDVIDLFQCFEIDLDQKDIPRINKTEAEPVSLQLLEQVRLLNELDIQLYEYAKHSLCKKKTHYPLRTTSFDQVRERATVIDYTFDQPLHGRGWTYRDTWNKTAIEYPTYRWVMNHPATIYFSLEGGHDYSISFNAWLLTEACVPHLRVNGREVDLVRLNRSPFSLYQGIIPKEYISSDFTEFSFYSEKSFLYQEIYPRHYNRNHPPLSFAVNRIQMCIISTS